MGKSGGGEKGRQDDGKQRFHWWSPQTMLFASRPLCNHRWFFAMTFLKIA